MHVFPTHKFSILFLFCKVLFILFIILFISVKFALLIFVKFDSVIHVSPIQKPVPFFNLTLHFLDVSEPILQLILISCNILSRPPVPYIVLPANPIPALLLLLLNSKPSVSASLP